MIYLVTKNTELFENNLYKIISVEDSIKLLDKMKLIGLDTETNSLSPFTGRLLSVQMGDYDNQVVIDCSTIDIINYKSLLESPDHTFLLWNAKFDIRFFYYHKIVIKNIWDGYLAEKLLWLGFPAGFHRMGLKDVAESYLGVHLDKSIRGQIIYRGLIGETIVYGANDVKYLAKIREKQLEELKKKDLLIAIRLENSFVKVLAYVEYCGVKLSISKWQVKMKKDLEVFKTSEKELNEWVIHRFPESEWCEINRQGDLFTGFDLTPKCKINWNSSAQVIKLLETLGFDLNTIDKTTGKVKKSVESNILNSQKGKSDILEPYLKYKAAQKLVSTYGQNFIDIITPSTGRIHTNYTQLMDTGRLSCGGKRGGKDEDLSKLRGHKVSFVNLQNLPADEETRACFVAEEGNIWISADYSGEESRLLADISGDQAMLDLFNEGNGDVHSLVAKLTFPDIIKDCPIEDIKKKFPEERKAVKSEVEFPIKIVYI